MKSDGKKNRCQTWTKEGKPCRAAATAGGLCFFHANPNKASELGRIGGKRNGHAAVADGDPLPSVYTASTVQDTIARLLNDLHSGKIHPSVATPMATLLNLQMRAIEATDHERKITELQRQLAETQEKSEFKDAESA
jgi:hypothetical protein